MWQELALGTLTEVIKAAIREGRLEEARKLITQAEIPEADKMSYTAVLMDNPQKLLSVLENQAPTEMSTISEDPRLQQAQMNALSDLEQRGQDGYTVEDKAAIARTMNESLGRQRGANMAMDSQMARRGISGSGIDLAGRMARQQAGIQSASQAGLDIAAQGRQRALQAMQMAGQLGGQIRGQEWGQKAQTATAQDAINRANTANRNQANQYDIGNAMNVNQYNADAKTETNKSTAQGVKDKYEYEQKKNTNIANTYK